MTFTHRPLATPLPQLTAEMVDGKRYYTTPDGNVYASITTVLSILSKQGIEEWRTRIGIEQAALICEAACNRGTDLHAVIESHLKNEVPLFPTNKGSKVKIMFNRMKRVLAQIDNIMAQEVPLYSDALRVAGRCDCIAEYDGVLSVIDFKSATKAKEKDWILSYFLQATAYSVMFEERTGVKCDQVVILICGEQDFSCQVFIEQRQPYLDMLREVIGLFNVEV